MKEEMMTAGTGGFSGSAAATGPNAGYDPVIKFRKKVKDKKLVMPGNKIKAESARQILDEKLQGLDEKLNKSLLRITRLRNKDNLNKKQQKKLNTLSNKVGRVANSAALTKINRLSNRDKPLTGAQSDKLDRLTNKVNKRADKALGKPLTSQQKTQKPLINNKSTVNSIWKAPGAGGVGPVQGNPTKAMNRFNALMSKDQLGPKGQNKLINKTAQVTRQDPDMQTASGKGAARYIQNNPKSFKTQDKGGPELGQKKSFYKNLEPPLKHSYFNTGSSSSSTTTKPTTTPTTTTTTTPKPTNTGSGTSSSNYNLRAGKNRKFDSSGGRRNASSYSGFTEAREAPCDRPSRLYQYKVTVPEMGTTIIYGSSPTELMVKFRMLFNPRFIKQIKIERVSPYQAGEIFYDKRMKHIRNIKPN